MPEPLPHLTCAMKLHVGALELDVSFKLTQPWTVLFGPSGSGKSTILRVIAGLTQPEQGNVTLRCGNQIQTATNTSSRITLPPHLRQVRWAAQRPALFPHLTVRENLRYATGSKHAAPEQEIGLALERFRLTRIATNKPATLSGGEQQRVSVARAAIAAQERLLLLDEPFTGLDAPLRDDLLTDLKAWLALSKTPVLSVTHDIAEAFQLNAEVIKLHEGRIVQQAPPATVLAQERSRLLAQLI